MCSSLRALLLLCAAGACHSAPDRDEAEKVPFASNGGLLPTLFRGIGGTIGRISQYNWAKLWNNQTANMIMRDDEIQSKCYGELGCVDYTDQWYHSLHRPVNFFPLERHLIAVKFWVHTRSKPRSNLTLQVDDPGSVTRAGMDAQKHTKFIIHGFLDTGTDDWVQEMVQRLLDAGDMNVIAVDWRFGALPMYQQAMANTQLVAMETAHLIRWLQSSHGLNVSRVHIIGHSLGAQTAGYVGAGVPGLGRVTGLDPAEPGFQHMSPVVRLDPGDARFVDVIHSDARSFITSGLGMLQPCGHLDFYPNGGREQPGCGSYSDTISVFMESSVDDFEAELFACRHMRAVRFFTDSIGEGTSCSFIGHECGSYEQFLEGECGTCGKNNERCAPMGYHADKYRYKHKINVPLYLTTSARAPYCLRHYRISVVLSDPDKKKKPIKGHLSLSMYGPRGKLEKYRLPKEGVVTMEHGETYSFLVQTPTDLGPLHRTLVTWQEAPAPLLHLPCLLWCPDRSLLLSQLTVLDMDAPESDEDALQRFCAADGSGFVRVKPGDDRVTLYNSSRCSPAAGRRDALSVPPPSGSRLLFPGPAAAPPSNRKEWLRLSEHTTDGAGPRRSLDTTRQPERTTTWVWSMMDRFTHG